MRIHSPLYSHAREILDRVRPFSPSGADLFRRYKLDKYLSEKWTIMGSVQRSGYKFWYFRGILLSVMSVITLSVIEHFDHSENEKYLVLWSNDCLLYIFLLYFHLYSHPWIAGYLKLKRWLRFTVETESFAIAYMPWRNSLDYCFCTWLHSTVPSFLVVQFSLNDSYHRRDNFTIETRHKGLQISIRHGE